MITNLSTISIFCYFLCSPTMMPQVSNTFNARQRKSNINLSCKVFVLSYELQPLNVHSAEYLPCFFGSALRRYVHFMPIGFRHLISFDTLTPPFCGQNVYDYLITILLLKAPWAMKGTPIIGQCLQKALRSKVFVRAGSFSFQEINAIGLKKKRTNDSQ